MKIFVRQQDLASKDTFLLLHLTVQGKLGLKVSNLKQKSVTRGWGLEKYEISVTYYLNDLEAISRHL